MDLAEILYRGYLLFRGRQYWHWRYYGPSYRVTEDGSGYRVSSGKVSCRAERLVRGESGAISIICSGPSVADIKGESFFRNRPSMVVNGSHSIYRGTDEVFSYYLVADVGFVRRQWKNFVEGVKKARSLLVDHRVLKEVLETDPDILGDKKVVLFDQVKRPFNKPLPTPGHVPEQGLFFNGLQEFSINPDHGFAGVKTVAYLALQVSIALGYDQIVYYGLDLGGSRRFYEEESPEKSMIDQDYEQFIEPHFAWGADACRTLGVKVVNASPYSRLPASIFPRVEPGSVEEFLNGRIIARD